MPRRRPRPRARAPPRDRRRARRRPTGPAGTRTTRVADDEALADAAVVPPACDPHEARSDACRSAGQQLGRVPREDRALVGLREPGLAHALDRVVDAHVERVVGCRAAPGRRRRRRRARGARPGCARASRTAGVAGTTTAARGIRAPRAAPATRGRSDRGTSAGSRRRAPRRVAGSDAGRARPRR